FKTWTRVSKAALERLFEPNPTTWAMNWRALCSGTEMMQSSISWKTGQERPGELRVCFLQALVIVSHDQLWSKVSTVSNECW
ncbi:MAG: hypothetical protein ABJQ14_00535, partial [Hyphomicrobiales bacterium]